MPISTSQSVFACVLATLLTTAPVVAQAPVHVPVDAPARYHPLPSLREQAVEQQEWLRLRLTRVLPALMAEYDVDMWILSMREYGEDPVFRAIAFFANLRNRSGFGPFGDQSIFVRADVFENIDGFDSRALLSDFDFVRRVRRRGQFRLLATSVRSSSRRWRRDGTLRTLWSHWRLSAEYLLLGHRRRNGSRERLEKLRRVR